MTRPDPAVTVVAPVDILGRVAGALLAATFLGSQFLITWILVGQAVAWVAGLLAGLWVALAVLGLPRLRRRMRGRPGARRVIDGLMGLFVLMVPLQAVVFTTLGIAAAGTILGLGAEVDHPGATFAIGSLYVALFLTGFGGLLPFGGILAAGWSRPGLLWRALGVLMVALGLAVGLGAGLFLDDWLAPLVRAWPPGRLSAAIFGLEAVLSALVVLMLRPSFTQRGWRAVACSPDGAQVLVARDRRAMVLRAGAEPLTPGVGGRLAAFSPCGRWAAVADFDGAVVLFDAHGWRPRLRLTDGQGTPAAATFSPDGAYLAVGDDDGFVQIWRAAEGRLVRQAETPLDQAAAVAFAGDAVVAMDRNYRVIEIPLGAGEPTQTARREDFVADESVPTFPRPFLAPGARRLALATGQRLAFFERQGDRWIPRPAGDSAPLAFAQVAFSPTGDHVGAVDHEGRVRVFAWDGPVPLLTLDGLPEPPNAVALDARASTLFLAGKSLRALDVAHGGLQTLWPAATATPAQDAARKAS